MAKSNLFDIGIDIKGIIAKAEARKNIPRSSTVEHSGMSSSNFYKAWHSPELFRIRDLYAIYEYLHVPEEERRYI